MSSECSSASMGSGWLRPAQVLRRRWFAFCLTFLLVGCAVCLIGLLTPRDYRASTEFSWRIESQPLAVLRARNPDGLSAALGSWLSAAQSPIITSHEAGDAIGRIEARIVRGGPDEGAIEILLSGDDARELARVVRKKRAETRQMIEHDVRRLCDELAAEMRREREGRAEDVRAAEEALHGYVAIMPASRGMARPISEHHDAIHVSTELSGTDVAAGSLPDEVTQSLDDLRTRLAEISERIRTLEARRAELSAANPRGKPAAKPPRTEGLRELEGEIRRQETRLADLLTIRRMTAEHPDVKDARLRLNQLHARREALLAEHDHESPVVSSSEFEAAHAERDRIETELAEARSAAEAARDALRAAESGDAARGADLITTNPRPGEGSTDSDGRAGTSRESDRVESMARPERGSPELEALLARLAEARGELDAWNRRHAGDMEAVSSATLLRLPGRDSPVVCSTVRPDVPWLITAGIIGALALAAFVAVLRDWLDDVIRTPEQAEMEARAPILAVIEREAGASNRRWGSGAVRVVTLGVASAVLATGGYLLWRDLVHPDVSGDGERVAHTYSAPLAAARSGERE